MKTKYILTFLLFTLCNHTFSCEVKELVTQEQTTIHTERPHQIQTFNCGEKLFRHMLSVMEAHSKEDPTKSPCVLVLDIDDNLAKVPPERPLPTNWHESAPATRLAQALEENFDAWEIYKPYICFVSSRLSTPEMLAISIAQLTRLMPKTFAYARAHHFSPTIPADIPPESPLHGITHSSHIFHMGPKTLDPTWIAQFHKSHVIEGITKRHNIPLGTPVLFADDTRQWLDEALLRKCKVITHLLHYTEIEEKRLQLWQEEMKRRRILAQTPAPELILSTTLGPPILDELDDLMGSPFVPVDTDDDDPPLFTFDKEEEEERARKRNERLGKDAKDARPTANTESVET